MIRRGFTLIELLVVITILAILAGAALPYVQNYVAESRIAKAKTDLEEIARALAVYETREGDYTKDSVADLTGRYLNKAPIDPWGKPYFIDVDAGTVYSGGPDRDYDTEEDNIQAPYQPPLALVSVKWVDRNQSGAVDIQNTRDQIQLVFSRKLTPTSDKFIYDNLEDWFVLSPDGTTPSETRLAAANPYITDYTEPTTDYRPNVLSTNPKVVVLSLKSSYINPTTPLSPGAAYIYVSTPTSTNDLNDLALNLCISNQKVLILPQ